MIQSSQKIPYLFLLPALLIMGVAALYPSLMTLVISLYDWSLGSRPDQATFIGLDHFLHLFADTEILNSLWTSIVFAFWVVGIEMILGIALALLLENITKGARLFRALFILPMMIAPIVVGLIWRVIFDAEFGLANWLFIKIGLSPQAWLADPDLAFIAVILADIWQWTPFVFILIFAGLKGLDQQTFEAAKMDGASTWQILWHIKLPMLMPVIMVTLLMRLIEAFRVLEVIYIMTFGGPGHATEILSMGIYKIAFIGGELGHASAAAVLLLVIVGGLSAALMIFSNPLREK